MPGDLALLLGAPALVADGRRALPPLADRVLLADVARKHPGYFAPVAETPGFGEALFRLVRELRGAGYDLSDLGPLLDGATDAPEKAGRWRRSWPRSSSGAPASTAPTTRCWPPSPARLDGLGAAGLGAARPAAGARAAARRRRRADAGRRLPARCAGRRRRAARASSRAAGRARRDAVAARGPAGAPRRRSTGSARRCSRRRRSPAIAPTGRCGSCRRPTRRARCGRPRARACSGRAEGVPFWEMAVAYRHGEAYRPLVEAVFIEAGIPVYLHEGSPLAERPLGRQTLALLDLYDSELSRQSVMDFLTDARFPERAARRVRRDLRPPGGTRSRARPGSSAAPSSGGSGSPRCRRDLAGDDDDGPAGLGDATRIADAGAARAVHRRARPRGLRAHPARAPWAEHLDYLRALLGALRRRRSEEIVVALRGLERFTALEARGRVRVVSRRRAAGDRDAALRGRARRAAGRVRARAA